jgi:hypothetical protein
MLTNNKLHLKRSKLSKKNYLVVHISVFQFNFCFVFAAVYMHKLYLFKAKGNLSNKTPNVIITLAEFEVTSKKDCGLVSKNFTSNL